MGYIVQLLEMTVVTTNTALSKQNEARELEYHVGGRLNHMTFVLLKKKEGEPAEGAVVVSRYTPRTSAYSQFGVIRLDLTRFFQQDFHQSSDGQCAQTVPRVLMCTEVVF